MKQELLDDIEEAYNDAEQHIKRLKHYEQKSKNQNDYVKLTLELLQEREIAATREDVFECIEYMDDRDERMEEEEAEGEIEYQAQRDEEKFLNMGLI